MPEIVRDGPFPLLVGFLLVVVFCRAQATYWLGRAVAAGALRTRFSSIVDGRHFARGTAAIERWGWPIIPLSFLTIGFQTAVNGAAGLLRMRWPIYTLAMLPGCVVWAFVYAVGGLAAFTAGAALAARSPWALAGALAAVAVIIGLAVVLTRRRRRARAYAGVASGK